MSSPTSRRDATPTSVSGTLVRVGGRYRLQGEMGRGGMATVHRARDEVLDRAVAVKLLHAHLAGDPAFLDRFRREARAAAALAHPNVVTVYDWGEADDGPFLVLQLIEGQSLREVLRQREQLDPAEVLAVLGPAAEGIGAANDAGLVHRDVKPENVLLGTDGTVRVTDFGLARAAASATSTFGADVLVGSPHYLSPEAVRGEALDPRADVYALGVLLYEALVGRPPFEGDSPFATAVQHTSHRIPCPSDARPGIARSIDEVVLQATAPERADRFADGRAFAAALADAIREPPTPIGTLLDAPLAPDPAASPTAVIPVEATETTIVADAEAVDWDGGEQLWPPAVPHGPPATDDGPPADDPEATGQPEGDVEQVAEQPRRRRGWLAALIILLLLAGSAAGGYLLWDRMLSPMTQIPAVVEAPEAAAVSALEDAGFVVDIARERPYSLEILEGHVLSQSPDGAARRGATVHLVISAGPRPVELPDVRGETREEAAAMLERLQLQVEVQERHHEEVPENQVIAMDPTAGQIVRQGATVTVTVSRGREPIGVPDVHGRPLNEALDLLRDAGLVGEVASRTFSSDVPKDAVIAQDPDGEAILFRGDVVALTVSDGPQPVEVPNVRGERVGDAVKMLEDLGFEVEVDRRGGFGAFLNPDRVFDQDPGPGASRLPGTKVTLYAYEA